MKIRILKKRHWAWAIFLFVCNQSLSAEILNLDSLIFNISVESISKEGNRKLSLKDSHSGSYIVQEDSVELYFQVSSSSMGAYLTVFDEANTENITPIVKINRRNYLQPLGGLSRKGKSRIIRISIIDNDSLEVLASIAINIKFELKKSKMFFLGAMNGYKFETDVIKKGNILASKNKIDLEFKIVPDGNTPAYKKPFYLKNWNGKHKRSIVKEKDGKYKATIRGLKPDRLNIFQLVSAENDLITEVSIFYKDPYSRDGSDFAVLIGVDDYGGKGNDLTTPIKDISAIGTLLNERFDFKVVLYRNPSANEIYGVLDSLKRKNDWKDHDQLFISLNGHGVYESFVAEGGKMHFDRNTHITYDELQDLIDAIKCRKIFVLLHSCYSGTFFRDGGEIMGNTMGEENFQPLSKEDLHRQLNKRTRFAISSTDENRKANDRPVEGKGISPFTNKFIKAISERLDNGERIITNNYIKDDLRSYNTNPLFDFFGSRYLEANGEFFFIKTK